jgi:hypothetical protein
LDSRFRAAHGARRHEKISNKNPAGEEIAILTWRSRVIGKNEFLFNQATIVEAVQEYLNGQMKRGPKVIRVVPDTTFSGSQENSFRIEVIGEEPPQESPVAAGRPEAVVPELSPS